MDGDTSGPTQGEFQYTNDEETHIEEPKFNPKKNHGNKKSRQEVEQKNIIKGLEDQREMAKILKKEEADAY